MILNMIVKGKLIQTGEKEMCNTFPHNVLQLWGN